MGLRAEVVDSPSGIRHCRSFIRWSYIHSFIPYASDLRSTHTGSGLLLSIRIYLYAERGRGAGTGIETGSGCCFFREEREFGENGEGRGEERGAEERREGKGRGRRKVDKDREGMERKGDWRWEGKLGV